MAMEMHAPVPPHPHQCSRCKATFDDPEELQSHGDWHVAKDLQEQEDKGRVSTILAQQPPASRSSQPKRPGAAKRGRGGKLEQGQSRLRFG